jgi:hypothetical protein
VTAARSVPSARPFVPRRTLATGVLFVIGSALFALGAILDVLRDQPELAGWTYFIGSIFFTTAAALQWLSSRAEVVREPSDDLERRVLERARNVDWSSAAIQLVGTVLFNVSTVRAATLEDLSVQQENQLVWAPDGYGSILFLVSSLLAFMPEVRARRHAHARSRSWRIAALNVAGSVFFGLSAIGAFTLAESGDLLNTRWSNLGTFLGALCFLVAAAMLTRPSREQAPT